VGGGEDSVNATPQRGSGSDPRWSWGARWRKRRGSGWAGLFLTEWGKAVAGFLLQEGGDVSLRAFAASVTE
jgi:hypothetical protein